MVRSHHERQIYLRLVSLEVEEEEVHELLCVPEVYRYLADDVEPPLSITREWIQQSAGDFHRFGGGLWALECSEGHRILGLARLSDFEDNEAQLTYLLHPRTWGQGLATRMAHTAMSRVFSTGDVSSIWAGADLANEASVAVMRKLGMKFRRDVEYPCGPGIEYEMTAAAFDDARVESLAIAGPADWSLPVGFAS